MNHDLIFRTAIKIAAQLDRRDAADAVGGGLLGSFIGDTAGASRWNWDKVTAPAHAWRDRMNTAVSTPLREIGEEITGKGPWHVSDYGVPDLKGDQLLRDRELMRKTLRPAFGAINDEASAMAAKLMRGGNLKRDLALLLGGLGGAIAAPAIDRKFIRDKPLPTLDSLKAQFMPKTASIHDLTIKIAFAGFAAKALPYAGQVMKSWAPRALGTAQKGIGSIANWLKPTSTWGANLEARGAKRVADWSSKLQTQRAPVASHFGALPTWQQQGLKATQYGAKTMAGMNTPGMMAYGIAGVPFAFREGAQTAANYGADQLDALAGAGALDRGKLALGLLFQPDMLRQFSQQIRTSV